MDNLSRVKRLPFVDDTLDNIVLTEKELHTRCFIANGRNYKRGRAHPFLGADLSRMHLSFLCDFGRYSRLHICDLSSNFISDIQPLSTCMNLIWLDIHNNHIEELPDEYFWSGMVSLRVLNAHDNPISTLINVKYLAACRHLEVLTLYDTPVAVHPFYRHCCVNKISTLKALDHHIISDDEVIEGFLCPPKYTKFAHGLKAKLIPHVNDGISGVFAVLRLVNFIQSKMSPCLFIQRVYRGYRCRKQLKKALRSAKRRRENGENIISVTNGDIFNLTAVMNMADLSVLSKIDVPDERPAKMLYSDRLPPIIPPTTPQTVHAERAHIMTTVPTASALRLIFHKLIHSNLLTELEGVMDTIRARRMDGKVDEYVRDVAETVFDEVREEIEMAKKTLPDFLNEKELTDDAFFNTKSYSSVDADVFDMAEYRVPTGNYLMMVPGGEPLVLSNTEMKQLDAQMVKQADADYHKQHRMEVKKELAEKQEAIGVKPVNVNAVRDRVAAEENLTQQLACLAAVEKAYHERTVRERRFERATTILASREASTQAIRKQSAMISNAHEYIGHDIRTQRHLTHLLLSKLQEKEEMEKKANHHKRVDEKVQRLGKIDNFRAASDLRQRFCAISASINKYDWANRQQGVLERSRGIVEQVQHGKQAAVIMASERNRKRISDTVAVNQLELRRAHEAIESTSELDLELARKRVLRVKHERPERYPPQLPGPGSFALDSIAHAAYNPVVGTLQKIEEGRESASSSTLGNCIPHQEIVDIRERWKVLAGVPDGRIGLHPISADIS